MPLNTDPPSYYEYLPIVEIIVFFLFGTLKMVYTAYFCILCIMINVYGYIYYDIYIYEINILYNYFNIIHNTLN